MRHFNGPSTPPLAGPGSDDHRGNPGTATLTLRCHTPMSLASLPRLLRDDAGADAGVRRSQRARGRAGVRAGDRGRRARPAGRSPSAGGRLPRPGPMPASCTTTSCSTCPPARSCCSPRGRRCRSSGSARASRRWASAWRCCGGCVSTPSAARRSIVVAGVRALLQRLGPEAIDGRADPHPARATILDPDALLAQLIALRLSARGAGRAPRRGRQRGAIIDIFPSTADSPIRIDLWGDEVDRLTEFAVNDQRSTDDLAEAYVFPARELIPTDEVRGQGRRTGRRPSRGGASSGSAWPRARCSTAWRAGCRGWSTSEHAAHRRVAGARQGRAASSRAACATGPTTCSPRRTTWPARSPSRGHATPTATFPRLHADTDRLLASGQSMWTISSVPETPDSPMVQRERVGAGGRRRRGSCQAPARAARREASAWWSPPTAIGSAQRMSCRSPA